MSAQDVQSTVLRALDRGDVATIRTWHNDVELRRAIFSFPFPASDESATRWYDQNVASGDGRNAIFGIRDADDGTDICGLAMLRQVDWVHRIAWFGIFIGSLEKRRTGLATRAGEAMLSYAFDDLGLNRVALEVASENEAAIRLYTRLGFRHEGILRQARYIGGSFIDVAIMGALAAEKGRRSD